MSRRRLLLGGLALAPLMGCEEMRTPPSRARLPAEVAPDGEWNPRDLMQALADAFSNQGQRFAGQPIAMARAAAQLEYVTDLLLTEARFAMVATPVRTSMRLARDEVRQALGTRPEAPPRPVIRAYADFVRLMRERQRTQAAGALPSSLFLPGGQATVMRLTRPVPMPLAEQATAQLRAEVQRLDAVSGWDGNLSTIVPAAADVGVESSLTPGLGRGY